MQIALIAMLAYSMFGGGPAAGTYQIAAKDDNSIMRMDTRTGKVERCWLKGEALECAPVQQAAK